MSVFTRSDFLARSEAARRQLLPGFWLILVLFVLGIPALFFLKVTFPEMSSRVLQIVVWIVLGGSIAGMVISAIITNERLHRLGLVCPSCRAELVGNRRGVPAEAEVLTTGLCPVCKTRLLDAAETGPPPPQPSDHRRAIGIISLLGLGLVLSMVYGGRAVRERQRTVCVRRYTAALTAAESLRVDESRIGRKRNAVTCGELRQRGRLAPPSE